jgi:hypothetical protein
MRSARVALLLLTNCASPPPCSPAPGDDDETWGPVPAPLPGPGPTEPGADEPITYDCGRL